MQPDQLLFQDKSNALTVMTWPLSTIWGRALKECVSDPFTAATGIPVKHIAYTSVDLPQEILRACQRGRRPPCDLLYCNTIPAIHMAQAGLTDELSIDELPVLEKLNPRAQPVAASLSGWPFVIAYDLRYVLMYREAAFPSSPPESWKVMLDPALKGKVSLYPGGKGFFPIAQVLGGGSLDDIPHDMDACWEFLRLLRPQIRFLEFNENMTEHVLKGGIDVYFTALPNVVQWHDQGYGVSWHVPKEGVSVSDDALVVPSGLPREVSQRAKRYVALAMGRKIQQSWCARLGLCPMHQDIERPERFGGDPAYPDRPDDYSHALFLPNSIVEEYEHGLWREKFNEIFGK